MNGEYNLFDINPREISGQFGQEVLITIIKTTR